MSKPIALLTGVCVAGVLVLLVLGLTTDRREAFTLGVTAAGAVAKLEPGRTACQGPITIPDDDAAFDRVVAVLGTYGRPGPPVTVTVAPAAGGAAIARGRLAGGYADIAAAPTHSVPVGHVADRKPLRVCLTNGGSTPLGIYGNGDSASRSSTATIDGKTPGADLDLSFDRAESRSTLSLLDAIYARAALWRVSWSGAWLYVLFTLVLLAGIPALLVVALRDATRE